jgi:hypothetical protein
VLDRPHGHAFYEVVKNAANELTEQLADDLRPPVTPRICAMSGMEAAGIEPAQGSHHRLIVCGSRPPTICGASEQYARRQLALASAREVARHVGLDGTGPESCVTLTSTRSAPDPSPEGFRRVIPPRGDEILAHFELRETTLKFASGGAVTADEGVRP